jgi:aspartyl-tRNA(Asn)/glutamyl-tRNA(Gln) amidotransferase subunit C
VSTTRARTVICRASIAMLTTLVGRHFPAHGAPIPDGRDVADHGPDRGRGQPGRGPRINPMPEISRDEVAHLAMLARIDLSDAELDHLAPQLSVILESVASINGVAGDDVPPTSHALPLTNVFREDVVVPGLTAEEALSGAPAVEDQRFSVPRILGEEA